MMGRHSWAVKSHIDGLLEDMPTTVIEILQNTVVWSAAAPAVVFLVLIENMPALKMPTASDSADGRLSACGHSNLHNA